MKKIVESSKNLPAFSMNMQEFESFWELLKKLLENKSELTHHVDVKIKNEKIEFKSIDEFIGYKGFSENLTDFYLSVSSGEKRISIYTSRFINRVATVTVKGNDSLWVTVATETIWNYVSNHNKVWYSWVVRLPLIRALAMLIFIGMIVGFNLPKDYKIPHLIGYSLMGVYLALLLLSGARDKFLPGAKILILTNEIFYKKYLTELTLGLAAISAILAAIAVFK